MQMMFKATAILAAIIAAVIVIATLLDARQDGAETVGNTGFCIYTPDFGRQLAVQELGSGPLYTLTVKQEGNSKIQRLAATRNGETVAYKPPHRSGENDSVYIVDRTCARRRIADGNLSFVQFTPDGQHMSAIRASELVLIDTDTLDVRPTGIKIGAPYAWLDGERIVYGNRWGGLTEVRLAGGTARRFAASGSFPIACPEADRIAFYLNPAGIRVLDLGTGAEWDVPDSAQDRPVNWGPDADTILVLRTLLRLGKETQDLYIRSVKSTDARLIARNAGDEAVWVRKEPCLEVGVY